MTLWLGNVFSNDTDRLLTCGGFPSAHCMYFVRERRRGCCVGRSGGKLSVSRDGRRIRDVADDSVRRDARAAVLRRCRERLAVAPVQCGGPVERSHEQLRLQRKDGVRHDVAEDAGRGDGARGVRKQPRDDAGPPLHDERRVGVDDDGRL